VPLKKKKLKIISISFFIFFMRFFLCCNQVG
jgi:hypothetical protein